MNEGAAPALIKKLDSQFWHLLKSKNQMTLEGKLRNARFIGEMINFRVAPVDEAFHVLTKLMDDFVHHNVEVAGEPRCCGAGRNRGLSMVDWACNSDSARGVRALSVPHARHARAHARLAAWGDVVGPVIFY